MRRKHYIQSDGVSGSFSVEGQYTSIGLLIKNLLGASSTTGSDPYTHVYTIGGTLPTGLTIENVRGTGTSEIFEGCRLNSGTFAVSSGGVMTCEFDVIGETGAATPRATAGTPSFSATDAPILHNHAGSLSWRSATYDLVDLSLTLSNALAARQHLGSTVTKRPLRSDFQSVEMSVTVEVEDQLYHDFISDVEDDCSITFTSGSNSFAIELQNAYLSSASDPVSDANIVRQSLTFVGQSDGTNEGLKITVVNGNSSATSND
tara:strand:+ start:1017 stop:1799 length:783 start_codon:yes stop_codon:yes gene_type:complete